MSSSLTTSAPQARAHRPTGRCWRRMPERPIQASMPDRCPGANPGGSTQTQSCGLAAKAALLQGADRGFESLQDYFSDAMLRYANWQSGPARAHTLCVGRWTSAGSSPALGAAEKQTGGSVGNWQTTLARASTEGWSQRCCGFQSRLSYLQTIRPRGAAECSPACHAGDRGFKSHRGRLNKMARYANR